MDSILIVVAMKSFFASLVSLAHLDYDEIIKEVLVSSAQLFSSAVQLSSAVQHSCSDKLNLVMFNFCSSGQLSFAQHALLDLHLRSTRLRRLCSALYYERFTLCLP